MIKINVAPGAFEAADPRNSRVVSTFENTELVGSVLSEPEVERIPTTVFPQHQPIAGTVADPRAKKLNLGGVGTSVEEDVDKAFEFLQLEPPDLNAEFRESFAQFQTRVIAAFKHLGLDTRKHFPVQS